VKPENHWKAYVIVRIFDVTVKKAWTTQGWLVTFDLALDKTVVKSYISDAKTCSGLSKLSSDEPLLNHRRSCSYTPKELLALNGHFLVVDLCLGEGEGFHLFLSYLAIFKPFKSGTHEKLEFLTDDLRIRL
jgi:hypothetical protein